MPNITPYQIYPRFFYNWYLNYIYFTTRNNNEQGYSKYVPSYYELVYTG